MTFLVLSAVLIGALPLAAHLTGSAPSRLFAAAAIGFALCAGAEFWLATSDTAAGAISGIGRNGALHDTYYVVARSRYALSLAFVFATLGMAQYLKERASGARDARLTRALFWLLLVTLLAAVQVSQVFAQIAMPRRYVDYPGALRYLNYVATLSSLLSAFALVGLVTMLTIVPALRWLTRGR